METEIRDPLLVTHQWHVQSSVAACERGATERHHGAPPALSTRVPTGSPPNPTVRHVRVTFPLLAGAEAVTVRFPGRPPASAEFPGTAKTLVKR